MIISESSELNFDQKKGIQVPGLTSENSNFSMEKEKSCKKKTKQSKLK